jgi:hypothetical protein
MEITKFLLNPVDGDRIIDQYGVLWVYDARSRTWINMGFWMSMGMFLLRIMGWYILRCSKHWMPLIQTNSIVLELPIMQGLVFIISILPIARSSSEWKNILEKRNSGLK